MRRWTKIAKAVVAQVMAVCMLVGTTSSALAAVTPKNTVADVFSLSEEGSPERDLKEELSERVTQSQPSSLDGDAVIEDIARQFADPTIDPFGRGLSTRPMLMASGLRDSGMPAQFDLRDVDGRDYVTPVKFQNPFGTCWGFAAIAAAETSVLGNPDLVPDEKYDEAYANMDFSEKHLVYFVNTPYDLEGDSQYGEGFYYEEGLTTTEKFNLGGLPFYATSLFASGMGPIRESYDESLIYRGAEGTIDQRDGVDYCYSGEDNWDIDSSLRHVQSYELAETYILPTPSEINQDDEYVYNPLGTQAIKEQLLQKRAVTICFHADNSRPNQELPPDKKHFIDFDHWAHYTDDVTARVNHAVTIVGWDDSYSRENFLEGHQPPADGAWLVKNSWGSGENEFPNRGSGTWGITKTIDGEEVHTGYFWLSYYDVSIRVVEAFRFDQKTEDDYYLAQYDLMPVDNVSSAWTQAPVTMVNLFEIDVPCELSQVSSQTYSPGTVVTYSFYLLDSSSRTPTDGVKIAELTSEPYQYGGFHKEIISEEDYCSGFDGHLESGELLAVAVTQVSQANYYVFNCTYTYGKLAFDEGYTDSYAVGIINPGESFIKVGNDWFDFSSGAIQEAVFGEDYRYWAFDNFPIKVYLDQPEPVLTGVDFGDFEDVAQALYRFLREIDPDNDTGLSIDGSTVSFHVNASYTVSDAVGALKRLATYAIRAAVDEGSLPESYAERLLGVGSKALDEYSSEDEWLAELSDDTLLSDGQIFMALWAKPLAVAQILVKTPVCGTVTETPVAEDGTYDWSQQTNRPEAVVVGEHVSLDDSDLGVATAWIASAELDCREPFNGMLRGGNHVSHLNTVAFNRYMFAGTLPDGCSDGRFAYALYLAPDFGYFFTERTQFLVNGKLAKVSLIGGTAEVVGTVEVVHDWDALAVVRQGYATVGIRKYVCKGCGSTIFVDVRSRSAALQPILNFVAGIYKHFASLPFIGTVNPSWLRGI